MTYCYMYDILLHIQHYVADQNLIDKKVIDATEKLGQQLLASIALYTDAAIGQV